MTDELRVVYQSRNRGECADRSLVLTAANIPHQLVQDADSCALLVPAQYSIAAGDELRAYDDENPVVRPAPPPVIKYHDALPGVVAYFLIVCLVAGLAGRAAFGLDWRFEGRIDGELLRAGEWWRSITALTLHLDLEHLVGNLVFGLFFGWFAGRLMGSGVAWLAIVIAGALGNIANTLFLDPGHKAIGASTAVFAALGLTAGFVWRSKFMSQERWVYRFGPIVGGLALLMFTGTGDENTDIGAHLMGFVFGLGGGMLLSAVRDRIDCRRRQQVAGSIAVLLVIVAWFLAFVS